MEIDLQSIPWSTYAALVISSAALVVAVWNYRRKSGLHIRGNFTLASSRACEDRFVSEVVLENLKDRSVAIFNVYLKVGYSIYIHLESFEESPLILKPFELHRSRFGPIEFYGFNMRKIQINALLQDDAVRKILVLATSSGRYKVTEAIAHWDPTWEHFRNHLTGILTPILSRYENTDLGGNISYVVELAFASGKKEIIPLGKSDYSVRKFKRFKLTSESLENKDALELYLLEQHADGLLNCEDIKVHDLDVWRSDLHESYKKTVSIEIDSFVGYHIVGRVLTRIGNIQMWYRNRQSRLSQRNDKRKKGLSARTSLEE